MRRLPFVLFLALTMITATYQIHAEDAASVVLPYVKIIDSDNLQQDGTLAKQKNLPILLLFGMEDCAYCRLIEEDHLKPMLRNKAYQEKVIIRRIHTDSFAKIINFDGSKVDADVIARRYGALFSPTVVFLDSQGNQLAPKLVGVTLTDFYGYELDQAIDLSLSKMRNDLAQATPVKNF